MITFKAVSNQSTEQVIDLAIVATNADVRLSVQSVVNFLDRVNALLLEKNLLLRFSRSEN